MSPSGTLWSSTASSAMSRNYAGTSFVTPDMFGTYRYGSDLLNITFDPPTLRVCELWLRRRWPTSAS